MKEKLENRLMKTAAIISAITIGCVYLTTIDEMISRVDHSPTITNFGSSVTGTTATLGIQRSVEVADPYERPAPKNRPCLAQKVVSDPQFLPVFEPKEWPGYR